MCGGMSAAGGAEFNTTRRLGANETCALGLGVRQKARGRQRRQSRGINDGLSPDVLPLWAMCAQMFMAARRPEGPMNHGSLIQLMACDSVICRAFVRVCAVF